MIRSFLLACLGAAVCAADLVDVTLPLWKFDGGESWSVWWTAGDPKPFHLDQGVDGVRLTLNRGKAIDLPFLDGRYREQLDLGAPSRIILDVDLESGVAATVALNLIDADGMAGHLASRALVPGRNRVEWNLSQAPEHTWGKVHAGGFTPPLHLWDMGIGRPTGEADVRLHFISATSIERRRLVDAAQVNIETGSAVHILTVGQERELALRVANAADGPQRLHVDSTWEDWDGHIQRTATDLDVPARGDLRWQPAVTIDRRGAWKVDCTLTDAAGGTKAERFWIAHLDPSPKRTGRSGGFLFGVVGGLFWPGNEGEFTRSLEALTRCGMRVVRGGVNWEYVQPEPGRWRTEWFDWFPKELERLDHVGIECQFLLCYTSKWAAPAEKRGAADMTDWLFAPPDPEAWRGYVREMAQRFHERIRFWEVWNETDIVNFWPGNNDQYLEILRIAHEELKRADANAQVLTSGFAILAGHGGKKDPDFAKKVVTKGRNLFDILALHLHGNFAYFRMQLDDLMPPLLAACTPRAPIYFNETAVNVDEVGEHLQAEQLAKKLLYAWGKGAIGYTWYNLNSGRRVTIPGGDVNWGLMTEDWFPRPVYSAFATLAIRLADATCGGFVDAAPGRIVVRLQDGETRWLAAWDEDPRISAGPQVVTIGADARASVVDIMGDERDLPVLDGKVLWLVGRTPTLLRVRGATVDPLLERPIIRATVTPLATPGHPCPVSMAVRNPRTVAQRIDLHWTLPSAWGGADVGSDVLTLAAGEERVVERKIPVPATGPRWGDAPLLNLAFALHDTAWAADAGIPMPVGLVVPAGGFDRPADLTMAERSQVMNLNENVPQRGHLMWTGEADCSATCWLGRDGDQFRLRVVVRDDIQRQPFHTGDIWRADSIQFGLSIPGQDGWWEMGMALSDDGSPQALSWIQPRGQTDPMGKAKISLHREGDLTTYEMTIPLSALATDAERLRNGIGFNLVVNDDDTGEREGWLQLAPGIAERKDPKSYIPVRCE